MNFPSFYDPHPDDDWLYENFFRNTKNQIEFLFFIKVLKTGSCVCGEEFELHESSGRDRQRFKQEYVLKCPGCRTTVAVSKFSTIKGMHISMFKIIQLLYKFFTESNAAKCATQTRISANTCEKYYWLFRQCIHIFVQKYYLPTFKFPRGRAIQMDEMACGRRAKHHRGRSDPIYVVNGVQEISNLIISYVVGDRTANTLVPIAQRHVHLGEIIKTDCHGGYLPLSAVGYAHYTNNHSLGFMDIFNRSNTNMVEGLNAILRHFLAKSKGFKHCRLQVHLSEFVLRRNFAADRFGLFWRICIIVGSMQAELTAEMLQDL